MEKDDIFFSSALQLARMYGVAETLCRMDCMDTETFKDMICRWVEEYLSEDKSDIVTYFEEKIKHLQ